MEETERRRGESRVACLRGAQQGPSHVRRSAALLPRGGIQRAEVHGAAGPPTRLYRPTRHGSQDGDEDVSRVGSPEGRRATRFVPKGNCFLKC